MKKPRIIAMYLPQFHETEQNNRWWGNGFTEWTAVRSAKSYFEGHKQPKVPYDNNYYDLMNKSVMEEQAALAHKYGVDGFCFYHYYFNDGDLILERPAENLLRWKDINISFCFDWDSTPWVRSWSRLSSEFGAAWGEKTDKKAISDYKKTILFDQQYGDEETWKNHFEYLLPFFQDERYIRIEGCPVFIFHEARQIPCFVTMVNYWQQLAKDNGLPGIYIIDSGNGLNVLGSCIDACMIHQPSLAFKELTECKLTYHMGGIQCYNYGDMWDAILKEPVESNIKFFYCALVGYDDTPRRGENGNIVVGTSKEIFYKGVKELINRSIVEEKELLFLNAWNEWGEGMYLEPDTENEYDYLEALDKAINESCNVTKNNKVVCNNSFTLEKRERRYIRENLEKYQYLYKTLNMLISKKNLSIKPFLEKRNINRIVIYGFAEIGQYLLSELNKEGIQVEYVVDRTKKFSAECMIYHPDENLPGADAVIITAFDYQNIYNVMYEKGFHTIFPIQQFLKEVEMFYENL